MTEEKAGQRLKTLNSICQPTNALLQHSSQSLGTADSQQHWLCQPSQPNLLRHACWHLLKRVGWPTASDLVRGSLFFSCLYHRLPGWSQVSHLFLSFPFSRKRKTSPFKPPAMFQDWPHTHKGLWDDWLGGVIQMQTVKSNESFPYFILC